jgi:hypothetical protein
MSSAHNEAKSNDAGRRPTWRASKPTKTLNATRSGAPTHFCTIKDVANRLGVSTRTVRRWIKKASLWCIGLEVSSA